MVSNLFTTITAQHWKLELARARSTPNSISAQIRAALCRGEKQADGKPTRTASAVDLPASPARTSTLPDVAGMLTADALGCVAGVGHQFSHKDGVGAVAPASREPAPYATNLTHTVGEAVIR
jgi:hypothetical protein